MNQIAVIGADPAPSPRIALEKGTVFLVGKPGDATLRAMTYVRRRGSSTSSPGSLEFQDDFDRIIFFTDSQIAFLQRKGEFTKVETADGDRVLPSRTLLSLDENERAHCERKRKYVLAVLALEAGHRRRRATAVPAIDAAATILGEAKSPGFTTVLDWMDLWDAKSDEQGLASLARKAYQRSDAPPGPLEQAVRYGITRRISEPKTFAKDALAYATDWLIEIGREDLYDRMPDVRTFQRRIAKIDRRIRAEGEYGPAFAAREFEAHYETKRPDRPLEAVEVDHTPFDVLAVSDDRAVVFGRPDVIAFRDRCTGSFLGMSIGFESPSYASFLDGLRHAVYPKNPEEFPRVENEWFAWGRFKRLYVDNALHFIGHNIHRAAAELKFEIAELPPGVPSMKGAQERLLGILNMQGHKLPGTVYSNVLEKRDRAELLTMPVLTLTEMREFLTRWICDEYHVEEHEGLGFLRTLKGIPRVIWNRSISEVPIAPMPSEEMFDSLAGDVEFRSITDDGIRWDHIRYQSADVEAIRRSGSHLDGREDGLFRGLKHPGSRYRVVRNPFDLGYIHVINPYLPGKPSFKVPAVRQDYASGLTLHQHRVHVANSNLANLRDKSTVDRELLESRKKVAAAIGLLLDVRKEQDVERRLARYLYKGRQREMRSIITRKKPEPTESGKSLLETAETGVEAPTSPKRIADPRKAPGSARSAASSAAAHREPADKPFDPEAFAQSTADESDWNQA